MLGIGVVGYGYWGPNLVRNFTESPGSRVVAVSDLEPGRLEAASTRYPGVQVTGDYEQLLANDEIDAIAIATPVSTHFELAYAALSAGKHVLLEKPLTETSDQGLRLIEEARHRQLILQVDHTFVYTGAVRKIKELLATSELGDIYYYDSVRVNLGLFQPDVNVIWDLAVHDFAILLSLFDERPVAVSATGTSHVVGKPANVAFLTLFYPNNMIAHIHVNWLAPVKIRQTLIGGSRKMVVYDDLQPSEKIRIYDKGIQLDNSKEDVYKTMIGYRTGDMWAPQLDSTEALGLEAERFIRSIESGVAPETDGEAGVEVVRLLEAATESLNHRGRPVDFRTEVKAS